MDVKSFITLSPGEAETGRVQQRQQQRLVFAAAAAAAAAAVRRLCDPRGAAVELRVLPQQRRRLQGDPDVDGELGADVRKLFTAVSYTFSY
jgi:hypothetical protein